MASIKEQRGKLTGAVRNAFDMGVSDGASETRSKIRTEIRRLKRKSLNEETIGMLDALYVWIGDQARRAAMVPGGLGRSVKRPGTAVKRAVRK